MHRIATWVRDQFAFYRDLNREVSRPRREWPISTATVSEHERLHPLGEMLEHDDTVHPGW